MKDIKKVLIFNSLINWDLKQYYLFHKKDKLIFFNITNEIKKFYNIDDEEELYLFINKFIEIFEYEFFKRDIYSDGHQLIENAKHKQCDFYKNFIREKKLRRINEDN